MDLLQSKWRGVSVSFINNRLSKKKNTATQGFPKLYQLCRNTNMQAPQHCMRRYGDAMAFNFDARYCRSSTKKTPVTQMHNRLATCDGFVVVCAYILINSQWTRWIILCRSIVTPGVTLRGRHNGRDGASNHQPHDYLLNCLFRRRSKKTSKLRVTGLCAGNSPHKWPVTRKMSPSSWDNNISMKSRL